MTHLFSHFRLVMPRLVWQCRHSEVIDRELSVLSYFTELTIKDMNIAATNQHEKLTQFQVKTYSKKKKRTLEQRHSAAFCRR